MQAPDYVQWHGFFEVAERFYMELLPEARELIEEGKKHGKAEGAEKIEKFIAEVLDRPEHMWFQGKDAPGRAEHGAKRKAFMDEFNAKPGYGK